MKDLQNIPKYTITTYLYDASRLNATSASETDLYEGKRPPTELARAFLTHTSIEGNFRTLERS